MPQEYLKILLHVLSELDISLIKLNLYLCPFINNIMKMQIYWYYSEAISRKYRLFVFYFIVIHLLIFIKSASTLERKHFKDNSKVKHRKWYLKKTTSAYKRDRMWRRLHLSFKIYIHSHTYKVNIASQSMLQSIVAVFIALYNICVSVCFSIIKWS